MASPPVITLNVGSLNIKPGTDATPHLYRLIQSLKKNQSYKIVFPTSRYDFYPDKASELFDAVSNNTNGLKRVAFPLINIQHVEIDGQGSSFIFHGRIVPFLIERSGNIVIRNLSIDWKKPLHCEGTVVSRDTVARSIDLRILDECDYYLKKEEIWYRGTDWNIPFQGSFIFDSRTKRPAYNTAAYYLDTNKPMRAKEVAKGIIRVFNIGKQVPEIGMVVVDYQARYVPGIHVNKSANILLEDVTIYHAGAMGLVAEKSETITLHHFNVRLPPNSRRLMSVFADATHFVNCRGQITLDSCLFENMMDDATNVHGIYATITEAINDYTVGIKLNHHEQYGFTLAERGDEMQFINRNTLLPAFRAKVVSVVKVNEQFSLLRVDKNIRRLLPERTAVENLTWAAAITMKNCTVRQNRARGILISTAKRALIENNYFSSQMEGINISGDANYWYESGPVNDVLIRNNTFEDVGIEGGQPHPVLKIDPVIKKEYRRAGYYHKNIVFENNNIRTFDAPLITAWSVDGLKILNNKFIRTRTFKPHFPNAFSFDLQDCKHLTVQGNVFESAGVTATVNLIDCDAATTLISGQQGFAQKPTHVVPGQMGNH